MLAIPKRKNVKKNSKKENKKFIGEILNKVI